MRIIKLNYKKIIICITIVFILTISGYYIKERKVTIIANDNGVEIKEISILAEKEISLEEKPLIININTASKEELISLKNIGEVKAEEIINYRNENGPFKRAVDIINVPGIGVATYEKNKEFIIVN